MTNWWFRWRGHVWKETGQGITHALERGHIITHLDWNVLYFPLPSQVIYFRKLTLKLGWANERASSFAFSKMSAGDVFAKTSETWTKHFKVRNWRMVEPSWHIHDQQKYKFLLQASHHQNSEHSKNSSCNLRMAPDKEETLEMKRSSY